MRQYARIAQAIHAYREAHGYPPSLRDVQVLIGYASVNTPHYHVKRMRTHGLVAFEDGKARTIRLTEQGLDLVVKVAR